MISDTRVASERALLERSNRIHYGNLLRLPIANGGFLYVEPLFTGRLTTGVDDSTLPQLSRVLSAIENLGAVGSELGTRRPSRRRSIRASVPGSTPSPEGSVVPPSVGDDGELIDAVLELNRALEDVRQAQQQGFAAYGAALERLQSAIDVFLANGGGE